MSQSTFITNSGQQAVVRSVTLDDVSKATKFINSVSQEDTYITFSGEQLTEEDERIYLDDCAKRIQSGDLINLYCLVNNEFAGNCTIGRNLNSKKRGCHVGTLGLIVHKNYRHDGVGESLMRIAINEAWNAIPGLRIIVLHYIEGNDVAKRLYEKLGFKECGRLPKGMLFHGSYVDEVHMYLTKNEAFSI